MTFCFLSYLPTLPAPASAIQTYASLDSKHTFIILDISGGICKSIYPSIPHASLVRPTRYCRYHCESSGPFFSRPLFPFSFFPLSLAPARNAKELGKRRRETVVYAMYFMRVHTRSATSGAGHPSCASSIAAYDILGGVWHRVGESEYTESFSYVCYIG